MVMSSYIDFIRPGALIEGSEYLRREKFGVGERVVTTTVTFKAYHSCPAFVVVLSRELKICCPREELFLPLPGENPVPL